MLNWTSHRRGEYVVTNAVGKTVKVYMQLTG